MGWIYLDNFTMIFVLVRTGLL